MKLSHIARTTAVAALAAGSLAIGTGAAQADPPGTSGNCRADWTGPGQVTMSACGYSNADGGLVPSLGVYDGQIGTDACAQLLRVNSNGSTTEVHDYGCNGWAPLGYYAVNWNAYYPGDGTYVFQYGYWGTPPGGSYGYWGNVQSPRISPTYSA
ncbi:hypothetical protein [Streptacidiphilus fuscans]|uniref:Secreted protein n=1 Tax=Streptacidiphilus fuscans TaxID=2789292 RepID=A0A931B7V2_9ACTN|nr:hypothetical protein [Streptacidiphilus fuscans]MBF9072820.1 hypothetical protein [Streptacidiphilus fuscans]